MHESSFVGLITDFGTRDPYVAAMKAVIAARTRSRVMDLSHDIAPYDIVEAAWFLRSVVPWIGGGARGGAPTVYGEAVVVCVVDPGVGSERRIIAGWREGLTVLAPDNGVLTFIAPELRLFRSVENEHLFLAEQSATFHGRDRFAPVAAAIASGTVFASLGPEIDGSSLTRFRYETPEYGTASRGSVVAIDRFGNIVTDLDVSRTGPPVELRIGKTTIRNVARNYVEGEALGGPFMIVGSQGTLEVSLARASAAAALQVARLERVELTGRR